MIKLEALLVSVALAADDLADYHPELVNGIDYDVVERREIVFDDDSNTALVMEEEQRVKKNKFRREFDPVGTIPQDFRQDFQMDCPKSNSDFPYCCRASG
jgi:hypothetical protein